jgi:hypothetical protein
MSSEDPFVAQRRDNHLDAGVHTQYSFHGLDTMVDGLRAQVESPADLQISRSVGDIIEYFEVAAGEEPALGTEQDHVV